MRTIRVDGRGNGVRFERSRNGFERGTLSRLLNGKAGVSANLALEIEDIGWGTAEHWMRIQASYKLAQARRERPDARRQAESRFARPELAP